jgi:hypothetical protein
VLPIREAGIIDGAFNWRWVEAVMHGAEIPGTGFVIIGIINFARLVLGQPHDLALSERLVRSLEAGAYICLGAAMLAPPHAVSANVLGILGLLLFGASVLQFVAQRRRARRSRP